MKLPLRLVLIFLSFYVVSINAQQIQNPKTQFNDSIKSNSFFKKNILPISLIGLGILANHSKFEKSIHTNLRNSVGNNYEFRIDNYIQFAPIAELYIADAFGVKAKNHWFDQTKYLLISNLISSTITHSIKRITHKTRPNGSPYSFPSGHTTFAFTNATVLMNEFKDSSPFLAYSGYAFATTTGVFRMLNNKHWLSDVLVGAGIGMLATELVYYLEPFKNFNPFKKLKNTTFSPTITDDMYGFYVAYHF